jgi:hypothetical protein
MDRVIIKNIIIVSLILGAILGVLAPIPYVGLFMLLVAMLLAAPIVILFLIMSGKCDLTTTKDSIITGAIVGFSANITFSIAYSLIMVILSLVFHYSSNFFLTAMIINSPIWLTGVFIIFIGVLTATTNAFSAFATYYIINLIRDMYEKSHPNSDNYKM